MDASKWKSRKGCIYMEVKKGMYSLIQAGKVAQELISERLGEHCYTQSKIMPGLWSHVQQPIQLTLVVDNFAVKYMG